jgi:hypothetical protein
MERPYDWRGNPRPKGVVVRNVPRIITGVCKRDGVRYEISVEVSLLQAVEYLRTEYNLNKKHPSPYGLYARYRDIRVNVR